MRLQFQLKKINIDPVCHVQLARHAEEFHLKNNIYGLLYGALFDDEAEVTSILALPDGEKSTKQQLEAMQRRNDELVSFYNLDGQKIGLYMVCYTRNYWDYLQTIKYYQSYINTSFFLIYDFKLREQGKNPYKAFRLKDEFALKQNFKWDDLQKNKLQKDNPFEQIPVQVKKNELFELMMLQNRKSFLQQFQAQKRQSNPYQKIRQNTQQYLKAFQQAEQVQHHFNQNYLKVTEQTPNNREITIPFNDYCQFIGQALKLDNYQQFFKQYLEDNEKYQKLFQNQVK